MNKHYNWIVTNRCLSEKRPIDSEAETRTLVVENERDVNDFELPAASRDYDAQFYHLYEHRLKTMRERVRNECFDKWDDDFKLNGKPVVMKQKVLDIHAGQPCWAIGSIYCEMKYKPNVLEEVINDTYAAPDLTKSYTDAEGTDEIMLEDESGRVLLVGDYIKKTPFVTGTVIGVLGMEAEAGTFQVLDICYPTPLPQAPFPKAVQNNVKIALISGLGIDTTSPGRLLRVQLLQDLLLGRMSIGEQISNIGKLVILGNSVDAAVGEDGPGVMINCLEEFGKFLNNVLQSIPVDLMPGPKDPSDKSLPQQPLHKALFKDSLTPYFQEANKKILKMVTNPYKFNIEGLDILAVAGQNIDDICKYVIPYQTNGHDYKMEDTVNHRLDLMECTIRWQTLAPTAPDTLWTYPYKEDDPFILNEWPHVYIAGNQPNFGTRDLNMKGKKVKLISLPEFSSTGSITLLDLKTLDTDIINIEI
ncbi:probable DNA polymerase delta small subunit [Zygosaccharomyces bailii ISA1307]|nr:probable DNA polymerase delta small subunit [Zygosaccharomyces bailii ISA1307]